MKFLTKFFGGGTMYTLNYQSMTFYCFGSVEQDWEIYYSLMPEQ